MRLFRTSVVAFAVVAASVLAFSTRAGQAPVCKHPLPRPKKSVLSPCAPDM